MDEALIYDWNRHDPQQRPSRIMLNDETLRDGLQSPSVRAPSIEQKLQILHLLDKVAIDTADIGLPGAGAHVVRRVPQSPAWVRRMADRSMSRTRPRRGR